VASPARVLVVGGSAATRREMRVALVGGVGFEVVGEASSLQRATELAGSLSPSVIVIEHSGSFDAFEVAAAIMAVAATPIVIMGPPGLARDGVAWAREVGAVAFVRAPTERGLERRAALAEMLYLARTMAGIKVVTRFSRASRIAAGRVPVHVETAGSGSVGVVAVGSSTGGPQALATLLGGLPKDFPVPLLIVQHLAVGFQSMLQRQLNDASPIPVMIAADGMAMAPGVAYIGPDEMHLGVGHLGRIELSDAPPEGGLRPAVSYLFRSVRRAYGSRCIGVLLTGMGRDGADEMALMSEAGAVTIAQDEQSSVVFGMAKEAIALGGATYVRDIGEIAPTILDSLRRPRGAAVGGSQL